MAAASFAARVAYEEISPQVAREELATARGDADFADQSLAAWAANGAYPRARHRHRAGGHWGAPARTFGQWVTDHADDFDADADHATSASTSEVAEAYVALCRAGRFDSAMDELMSP